MSRAFIMREVEAISTDLSDIAKALDRECAAQLKAARENEQHREGEPQKGYAARPISDWQELLSFEKSRLETLLIYLKILG
jgi:hypothetical protein